jgi:hypothetical protein
MMDASALLRMIGLDPVVMQQAVDQFKADVGGFKTGFSNAMNFFRSETGDIKNRLERIERQNAAILHALRIQSTSAEVVSLTERISSHDATG